MIARYLVIFITAFVVSAAISPLVIYLCKKMKAKQTILHYVEEHKSKQGTPTMGGIIFIVTFLVVSLCFLRQDYLLSVTTIAVTFAYAILGFLDDFLKVHYKQNLGLRAYQKIIGQLGIAIIIALFVYRSNLVGTEIFIPFTKQTINIGWGIIPIVIFIYLAVVNSVNLIDGLDGLAGGVSFVYIVSFVCIMFIYQTEFFGQGLIEQQNLQLLCFVMSGALLAYFMQNCFPANVFMGDTGSLALGGFITTLAVFSRLELYIPILGFAYVITALSDIIQVAYYKRTKRRIFLMAPLHHHFQKKGVNENKIVTIYIITTMIICLLTISLILYLGG
ncbi:MAG: phospho-N-acetylmuramoyl-pentapeptide-transferase [Clostridia bacterium]|nr:phospho-N-acetylmuramoyl-pentapeptide-transferase [Clostridia bacterium]